MKEFSDTINTLVYDPEQAIQCVSSYPSVKLTARQLYHGNMGKSSNSYNVF